MTIRNLDDDLKSKLRIQAAQHGRSMEEEARDILRCALSKQKQSHGSLAQSLRDRVRSFGGIELAPPEREAIRVPLGE